MPNTVALWRAQMDAEAGRPLRVAQRVRNGLTVALERRKFRLRRSISPVHTRDGREIDTDFEYDGMLYRPKSMDFDLQVDGSGQRRFTPRPDHPDEWMIVGRLEILRGPQWVEQPMQAMRRQGHMLNSGVEGRSLLIAAKADQAREIVTVNSRQQVADMRWPLTLVGLRLEGDQVISLSDSETVLRLGRPIWEDSAGLSGEIPREWDGKYLTYTPHIPLDATYPISLDPDFGVSIVAGADDGTAYQYSTSPALYVTNTYIQVGRGSTSLRKYHGWARFTEITIEQGTEITAGTLTLVASGSGGSLAHIQLRGIDEDDHAAPTTYTEWETDHYSHTSASVAWEPTAWTTGTAYTSPDISTIFGEIIARTYWASSNDLGLHWDENSSDANGDYCNAASYENTSYNPPEIDITYVSPWYEVSKGWTMLINSTPD